MVNEATIEAYKAMAKVAAIKKGFDPDLAGNTSALLRYLVEDFTRKSGK